MCSGPGGGKTRFLDEFADLFGHPDKMEHVLGPNASEYEWLNGLVPISITYSDPSPYNEAYDAKGVPPPGFVLRVLMG